MQKLFLSIFLSLCLVVMVSTAWIDFAFGQNANDRAGRTLEQWCEDIDNLSRRSDLDALNNMGFCYSRGIGVTRDEAEAVKWYQIAAEKDFGLAQLNLGILVSTGQGAPTDPILGLMWLQLAAANGVAKADEAIAIASRDMTPEQEAIAFDLAEVWRKKIALQKLQP